MLFKIKLPEGLTAGLEKSRYRAGNVENFVIDEDHIPEENGENKVRQESFKRLDSKFLYLRTKSDYFSYMTRRDDIKHMKAMGEAGADSYSSSDDADSDDYSEFNNRKSISEIFTDGDHNKLIERAPNKMIDYFDGYIILGFRSVLVYLKINKEEIDEKKESEEVIEINVQGLSEIKQLNLSEQYKIICIQPLGSSSGTSIVLETLTTRQIRFIRVTPKEKNGEKHLKFVQLGVLVNHSPMTISKLLKYRSVCKYN